jgi:hypothetical protein
MSQQYLSLPQIENDFISFEIWYIISGENISEEVNHEFV